MASVRSFRPARLLAGASVFVCCAAPISCRPSAGLDQLAPHRNIPAALKADGAPMIRVLLDSGVPRLFLAVDGPFEIRHGTQVLHKGGQLPRTLVEAVGGPQPRLRIGALTLPGDEILIVPHRAGALLVFADGSPGSSSHRRYDGYAVVSAAGRGVDLVNVVSLERYLSGVLEGELYPSFHFEAFRAQAIAARTYALYEMNTVGRKRDYDVRATEASQVYEGLDGVKKGSKSQLAVEETRGVVCTWQFSGGRKIFPTYYSSACGGMTENVSSCLPYPTIKPLSGGVRCEFCRAGASKGAYRWGPVVLSKAEVTTKLTGRLPQYRDLGQISQVDVLELTPTGRPLTLGLTGDSGRRGTIRAYDFRLAMGGHTVRSTHCRILDRGGSFEFTNGQGFGHAVGMCQWGAQGQAEQGRKAGDILRFYYPGCTFVRAY
jgi:stage II sporulation protein D